MYKSLFIIIFFFNSFFNFSQVFEWAKPTGGIGFDEGLSVAVDASGNVYTIGYFEGTTDFNPGINTYNLTSAGSNDIYIQKLDASGNFLWAINIGNTNIDYGFSIALDNAGNVYAAGEFSLTVDFDSGPGVYNLTSNGSRDAFILKLDELGNFIWARSFGGSSADGINSIAIDASGNVYSAGAFKNTVDLDTGPGVQNETSNGSADICVLKLNTTGDFIWAKTMGSSSVDRGYNIDVDNSGEIYITGDFSNTVDFDPNAGTFNLTSEGNSDIYILKLDSSGNFDWAVSNGGPNDDVGYAVTTNNVGEVCVTGKYEGVVDFDPGAGILNLSSTAEDIFIQKLDSLGNLIWIKGIGGNGDDNGYSVATDAANNVLLAGWFENTVDFDPGGSSSTISANGGFDGFLLKLNMSGDFIWAKNIGGTATEFSYDIDVDVNGNVYSTGGFTLTTDLNPDSGIQNEVSNGSSDIYVLKLGTCSTPPGTDMVVACDSYTWIDGNTYTSSNNIATYSLSNSAGCDSLITLNLTINTVDPSINQVDELTLSAIASVSSYQWLDCDNNYNLISGATSQDFTTSINGSYAVEVSQNGCTDTSACMLIDQVGIIENNFEDELIIYPNPTTGNLKIILGKTYENVQIKVLDIIGEEVNSFLYATTELVNLQIDSCPGFYFVCITSEYLNARVLVIKK